MAKRESDLPAFVVDGQFEDHEWRRVAAKPEGDRTAAEKRTFTASPRLHPYGPNVYRDEAPDGTVRWFPDRAARDAYVNANEAEEEAARSRPSPTEGGPRQTSAQKKGLASDEKVQGQDGKGRAG